MAGRPENFNEEDADGNNSIASTGLGIMDITRALQSFLGCF